MYSQALLQVEVEWQETSQKIIAGALEGLAAKHLAVVPNNGVIMYHCKKHPSIWKRVLLLSHGWRVT